MFWLAVLHLPGHGFPNGQVYEKKKNKNLKAGGGKTKSESTIFTNK